MLNDVLLLHNKYIKWRMDLEEMKETLTEFGTMHKEVYKITNIPKYRSFQYRLMQRAIVTNIQLKEWGIKTSNLCSFCMEEVESITHLLYYCKEAKELWVKIIEWIMKEYNTGSTVINAITVMFNRISPIKYGVANFICLIVKQYIYKQKCLGNGLSFPQIKGTIVGIERMEKYIAVKNGRMQIHAKKWGKSISEAQEVNINEYARQYVENS